MLGVRRTFSTEGDTRVLEFSMPDYIENTYARFEHLMAKFKIRNNRETPLPEGTVFGPKQPDYVRMAMRAVALAQRSMSTMPCSSRLSASTPALRALLSQWRWCRASRNNRHRVANVLSSPTMLQLATSGY
jgi:hypothetical protein